LFWRLLTHIPAVDLLAHRVTWAIPWFLLAAVAAGQRGTVAQVLRAPRRARWMAVSALLVGTNWLVFLIAVNTDRVLHASLGYFLTPMVSTLLGALVLGERLDRWERLAVGAAFAGVLWLGVGLGTVPWIGLVLAASFGMYGLVRKQAPVPALGGTAVEVLFLAPLAIAGVAWSTARLGVPDATTGALLLTTGLVTAVPLILFSASVRRIPLTTMGSLQYFSPSIQFLIAAVLFGETFHPWVHLPAFSLIWTGVLIYGARTQRNSAAKAPVRP